MKELKEGLQIKQQEEMLRLEKYMKEYSLMVLQRNLENLTNQK